MDLERRRVRLAGWILVRRHVCQGKTGSGIRDTVSFLNRAQAWLSDSHPTLSLASNPTERWMSLLRRCASGGFRVAAARFGGPRHPGAVSDEPGRRWCAVVEHRAAGSAQSRRRLQASMAGPSLMGSANWTCWCRPTRLPFTRAKDRNIPP
jgi:hypothetical protein